VKRYGDAPNLAGAISETRRYDITGNLVTVSGSSCCEQISFRYTSTTQYAYPTAITRGAADPNSPARVTTAASYDFNTGLMLATTDANGRTTQTFYSPTTLRLSAVYSPTMASITYDFDDAALTIMETTRDNLFIDIAAQRIKRLNGLGLVRREETLAEGGLWDVVETQYDVLGRLWKQTRPFRSGHPAVERDLLRCPGSGHTKPRARR